jgi:hypothetical protein
MRGGCFISTEAESKEKHNCMGNIEKLFLRYMPELTITSPNAHVDSNTFTMGNLMPESTLTLCQSRLYLPVRHFGSLKSGFFIRSCNLGGEGCGLCAEYAEVAVKGPCHRCTTQHFLGVFCTLYCCEF